MDFSMELPVTYYALHVLELGATETILGMIGFSSFLALAAVQFPGGYLADKFGRRWLVSSVTFAVALCYIFFARATTYDVKQWRILSNLLTNCEQSTFF